MKFLLLLVVIVVAVWMVLKRQRPPGPPSSRAPRGRGEPAAPTQMLACAHCGVHLPQSEAVTDAAGRPFCSDAHRLAGPR
jgi:uncharacterized protein